jgi:hypothetical protein
VIELKLLEAVYQQKGVEEVLKTLGLGVDGTILLPWVTGEYALQDKVGNIVGYVFDNEEGGYTVTDISTNVIGYSHVSGSQPLSIHNAMNNQTYNVFENSFDGYDVYDSNMELSFLTDENVFGGKDFFSSNMELLGSTQEGLNIIDFEFPDVSNNIHSSLVQQLSSPFDFSQLDFYDSTSLFDILDIL